MSSNKREVAKRQYNSIYALNNCRSDIFNRFQEDQHWITATFLPYKTIAFPLMQVYCMFSFSSFRFKNSSEAKLQNEQSSSLWWDRHKRVYNEDECRKPKAEIQPVFLTKGITASQYSMAKMGESECKKKKNPLRSFPNPFISLPDLIQL